jgi:hypothetical protein
LVTFTDAWSDPFDDGTPVVRDTIMRSVAAIKSVQRRFAGDPELSRRVAEQLVAGSGLPPDYASSLLDSTVNLLFLVYAGRRSMIDATPQRHDAWSRLRDTDDSIEIKSYDSILDLFLER